MVFAYQLALSFYKCGGVLFFSSIPGVIDTSYTFDTELPRLGMQGVELFLCC